MDEEDGDEMIGILIIRNNFNFFFFKLKTELDFIQKYLRSIVSISLGMYFAIFLNIHTSYRCQLVFRLCNVLFSEIQSEWMVIWSAENNVSGFDGVQC